MKRRLVYVIGGLLMLPLVGCGVDGEPTYSAPVPKNEPGVRVSGDVRVGVSVTRNMAPMWAVETAWPGTDPG